MLCNRFDIQMAGNDWAESILHLHVSPLQTISPSSAELDARVPACSWHGETYRGHVFWHEMFAFPFLNFQRPRRERRGPQVGISLACDRLSVCTRPGRASPVKIRVGGETRELGPGMQADFPLALGRAANTTGPA